MKDSFSSRQWWRLPPVIVISLIAAVALLFLSGRAAVMAFAEGEDDITISFHANGASGSPPASITVEKGETFTLPSDSGGMTKEGYSLVRWSVTPDGSTNTWSLGSQECFYEDTVLYALWEKNVTVTFDLNGGTGSAPELRIIRPTDFGSYESFVMPGSTSDMAKEGFRFSHWDSEPDGSGDFYDPGTTYYNINQDLRLYAQWQQILYTLQHDKGRVPAITGSLPATRSDITLAVLRAGDVSISETKPEADGYTFTGWLITNSEDDSVSKMYDADRFGNMTDSERCVSESLFDSTKTATAVAQWTANYTVTYNVSGIPAGFDYPATQTDSYAEGAEVPLREKPSGFDESAYEFIGWSSEDIDVSQSNFTVDKNIIITGEFRAKTVPPQPVTYTVTYQAGGDSADTFTDTEISGDYTLLGVADLGFSAPEGKAFGGWRLVTPDDKGYPATTGAGDSVNVVSDVTYEAQWQSSEPPVNPTAARARFRRTTIHTAPATT